MDILHIPYVNVEDELTIYTTMGLIHKIVPNILMLSQLSQVMKEINAPSSSTTDVLQFLG
jgi:hypothetical protein